MQLQNIYKCWMAKSLVLMTDIIASINNLAFQFAGSLASPTLTALMNYFAISFYLVLIGLGAFLYLKKDKNLFSFALALVALFALSEILKLIFAEPRPCQSEPLAFPWIGGVCESGFGFPSSHATTLTGLYFFIKEYRYINALYIIWLAIIFFGRVYLGAHYLMDVIAGVIISIIVAAIIYRYKNIINNFIAKIANRVLKPLFGAQWLK